MTTPFDPNSTDFGTDVALLYDLANGPWGLAYDEINYAYSVARHLSQREGSMDFYDPTYVCFDLRGYCSSKLDRAGVSRLQGRINAAVTSDRARTAGCTSIISHDAPTSTLTATLALKTANGPFDLVLQASQLSLDILAINGVQTPQLPAVTAGTGGTIVIQAGSSEPGPPGPPGTSNPSRSFGLQAAEDGSGGEVAQLQTQFEIDWSTLGNPITVEVVGMGSDEGNGTPTPGVFRLRINGSDGAADGTAVATVNASSSSATRVSGGTSFANPGGQGRAILTVQSSAAGKTAVLRGATVVFQS